MVFAVMVFNLTVIAVGPINVSYLCSRVRAAFPKKTQTLSCSIYLRTKLKLFKFT